MNYIPGFSNYLETSVPRYADGGAVMGDAALTPEQREARRIAANTLPRGTSVVGPTAGKDPLAFGTDNTFRVGEGQEVRLVDAGGNVIFSGSGVEGANRAVAAAQSLSDELGKDANFKIQTGERTINPDGSVGGTRYIDVARAAPQQTGLGFLADYVLPFAATFIPGVGPVLGAALGSAASSGLQGRDLEDALKRAVIAAATAGVTSGTGLDKAIGGALSNTGGQAAGQVAGQVAGQAVGGNIVVTALSKAAQAAGGALGQAALSEAGNAASRALSNYKTPAEKIAEQPLPEAFQPPVDPYAGVAPIVVTGGGATTGLEDLAGLGGGVTASLPALGGLASDPFLLQTTPTEPPKTAEEPEDIVVKASKLVPQVTQDYGLAGSVLQGLPALGGLAMDPALLEGPEVYQDDILVEGRRPVKTVTQDPGLGSALSTLPAAIGGLYMDPALTAEPDANADGKGKKLGVKDYIDIATLLAGLIPEGKGDNSSGTIPGGLGTLSPLFNKQLPTSTLPRGGALPASTLAAQGFNSPQNYYRYGYGPEQSFFEYATQGAPNTSRAYTGYEGSTAEDAFAPQPITTSLPNNPAGPIMTGEEQIGFARGGFAVEGAGDGRDDKIPALLSDGEYVIDAETVALLGNGSNKAGAKLLDSFRVKVRKQKGKKLARGKFSDNAKRPEQYMAGGPA